MHTPAGRYQIRKTKGRQMTAISIRLPEDVIEDLKEVAPMLGFSGYQPLIRSYVGHGLRADLEKLSGSKVELLTKSLREQGVSDEIIAAAIAEARMRGM